MSSRGSANNVGAIGTHYDVLGLAASATPAEIRDAYRSMARTHHPDQRAAGAPSSSTTMAELNEAYRVLRDPARRSRYDADLRLGRTSSIAGSRPPFPTPRASAHRIVDATPARYPWRLVGGMAAVGALVVLAGTALYEPAAPDVPDNVLTPGSCVVVEMNDDVREVNCTGAGDLIVRELVPLDRSCPLGLSAYRDRQGMGVACVSPGADSEPD